MSGVSRRRSGSSADRLTRSSRMSRDQGRHAVRSAVGQHLPGRGRRAEGRVPAAPRPAPYAPAAQGPVPRQRLGAEGARGQGRHQPVRRRQPAGRREARRLRPVRPVRRPDQRTGGHLLRRPNREPRQRRRHLRPDPARDRRRGDPRARDPPPRARHGRRHPGPALLDPGRVEAVQRRRLCHQHDPVFEAYLCRGSAWRSSTSASSPTTTPASWGPGGHRPRRLEVFQTNAA